MDFFCVEKKRVHNNKSSGNALPEYVPIKSVSAGARGFKIAVFCSC
jgi:hypothetical protein